jgi:hypothetical protein
VPALVQLGDQPRLDRRVHARHLRGDRIRLGVTGIGLVDDGLPVVVLVPRGRLRLAVLAVERAALDDLPPLVAALGVAPRRRRPVRRRRHGRAAIRVRHRRRRADVLADRSGVGRRLLGERRRAQRK